MATMKDIAALAGVSTATVSHVLSGKRGVSEHAHKRVLEAVSLTQYTPNPIAKSLRTSRSSTIGVLVEDISAYPVPEIVDGISEYLDGTGNNIILGNLRLLGKLYNHYEQLSQYKDIVNQGMLLMTQSQVDGVIYVSMHDRRIEPILSPINKPLVYAYAYSDNPATPSVTYDNEESARIITRILIERGHRYIALIAGHPSSSPVRLRLKGYRAAMDEAGILYPTEYIRWGDWEYHSGYEQTKALLDLRQPPTAIFAMNDLMAAGSYAALTERGLNVPSDMSIAGFDNREISSYLYPPLTTLALPHRDIGRRSCELALTMLAVGEPSGNIVLPCDVVMRSSVKNL
ncbi:DNA-binding transcriptional regulator CytR [Clostridia bacterium]|nr:DNA-binding transcriptional regulator CytR [Clostridia bacterium]